MLEETFSNAKILIIDDEAANVRLLERILHRNGYTRLWSITDSREAIQRFKEVDPDLILLDLLMPFIDGYQILEQLGEIAPPNQYLPILVLTADITPQSKQRALALGARDFLTKPLNAAEIVQRMRNLLEIRFLQRALQHSLAEIAALQARVHELENKEQRT